MSRAALEACPYARKCGGCDIIEMPYDKQLKLKQERIEKLLAPVAKAQAGQMWQYNGSEKGWSEFHGEVMALSD